MTKLRNRLFSSLPVLPPVPLGEIPEAQATGETAVLYADLRAVLGIPVVNLIWRHIATLPGGLAWSWAVVRPLYASGAVAQSAMRLVAGLQLPTPAVVGPPLSATDMAAAGMQVRDVAAVVDILDIYHRANPMNLVALSVLRAQLQAPTGATPPPDRGASPAREGQAGAAEPTEPPPHSLPPLLTEAEMAPRAGPLVRQLAALGVGGAPGELPTVWRHLAHWPGYLELALARLQPLEDSGWLAGEMEALRARRDRLAAELARRSVAPLPLPDPPATATRAALQAVLGRFTDGLIVRMIPLLAVLRQITPRR